jgi:hypothetical protein
MQESDGYEELGEKIGLAVLDAIVKAPEYADILVDEDADPSNLLLVSLARVHFLYATLLATARSVITDEEALHHINETVMQTMLVCLKEKLDPVNLAKVMRTNLPLMTEEYLEQFHKESSPDVKVMAVGSKRTQ